MSNPSEQILELITSLQSTIISSIATEGQPHTSYAPFVMYQEHFYVFISDAARHTQNLIQHPACSLLFIDDESKSEQIFARRRVSLECRASEMPRDTEVYKTVLALLQKRFGGIVAMLSQMQDFRMIEFEPLSGEAVFGFGEAFSIDKAFETITPKRIGHAHSQK